MKKKRRNRRKSKSMNKGGPRNSHIINDRGRSSESSNLVPQYVSIENGPLCFLCEIIGAERTLTGESVEISMIPVEDTIRPVPLSFAPPLSTYGTKYKGFDYHWQQLTYLFDLKDPKEFISGITSLVEADERLLRRYIETCRNLAGYSVINGESRFEVSSKNGIPAVRADLPNHQEFSGFSATFRQLNNDGEEASFNKAWKIINKSLTYSALVGDELAEAREDLKAWKQARHCLQETTASALICGRLDSNYSEEHPRSLKGIVPKDLIQKYNYGDTLHWGNQREQLAELTDDPAFSQFYKFCCVTSMVSLSHVYFGFAELVEVVLG